MANLVPDQVTVPDGVPAGAPLKQKMKSVGLKVDAGGKVTVVVPNYSLPTNSPTINQIIKATSATASEWADQSLSVTTVITTSTTLVNTGNTVNIFEVDCSLGAVTITLPLISTVPNQRYLFIKTDSSDNKLTLDGDGAETINGELTRRVISQYDTIFIIPNSALWYTLSTHLQGKTLVVDRTGSGNQSVSSGSPVIVEFDNVIVDSGDFYDGVTNYAYSPGNAVFQISVSIELLQLDSNDFVEICVRKSGVNVGCARVYATANNQDLTVDLNILNSNTDPSPGDYDVTVEHNQGANLNLSDDAIKTYWNILRVA